MNKDNKKYDIFRQICRMTSISEERLYETIKKEIAKRSTFRIMLNNTRTQMAYMLNIVSQVVPGEYLVELYEDRGVHEGAKDMKLIIKNRIRITKPVFARKRPAVSAIMGIVILLAVAGIAGGAFFSGMINLIDETYFEVDHIVASSFDDDTDWIYLELEVSSSVISDLVINGDLKDPITLVNDWDGSQISTADTTVLPTKSGLRATFDGAVQLDKNVSPRDTILLEFQWDDEVTIATAEVRKR